MGNMVMVMVMIEMKKELRVDRYFIKFCLQEDTVVSRPAILTVLDRTQKPSISHRYAHQNYTTVDVLSNSR